MFFNFSALSYQMLNIKLYLLIITLNCAFIISSCAQKNKPDYMNKLKNDFPVNEKIEKADAEWKKELTPEQYRILREKGTERAFTGKFWNMMEDGKYYCAGCNLHLFDSDTKFESSCGWPSFFAPADKIVIAEQSDLSYGMVRKEVMCARCGGHLGHVFEDGPKPTGLRYCINSESLKFVSHTKQ
jgi:peptide-methionine (R)-S-oxide reductase